MDTDLLAGVTIRDNRYVDILPTTQYPLNATIEITVTDPQGNSDSQTFMVHIREQLFDTLLPVVLNSHHSAPLVAIDSPAYREREMKRKVIGLIFVVALLLTACTVPEVALNESVPPDPTEMPVEALPAATASAATEPAVSAESVATPTTEAVVDDPVAEEAAIVEVSAESTLLNTDWNDRTPFASGLISSEQSYFGRTRHCNQLSNAIVAQR